MILEQRVRIAWVISLIHHILILYFQTLLLLCLSELSCTPVNSTKCECLYNFHRLEAEPKTFCLRKISDRSLTFNLIINYDMFEKFLQKKFKILKILQMNSSDQIHLPPAYFGCMFYEIDCMFFEMPKLPCPWMVKILARPDPTLYKSDPRLKIQLSVRSMSSAPSSNNQRIRQPI